LSYRKKKGRFASNIEFEIRTRSRVSEKTTGFRKIIKTIRMTDVQYNIIEMRIGVHVHRLVFPYLYVVTTFTN